ncbi:MAG TPA: MurR/RpiR family transcriptional regulator [Candidatus Acidoferrales bacterium]|nr:MurR/RpiR family transcriptional regulator [Candidatus Acidoferrales bacterium]
MTSSARKQSLSSALPNGQVGEDWSRITALEENFDRASGTLSASRKNLVEKILQDSDETYFLSSRELAKRYGVNVGTVVRTTQALGYRRYADFISDLRAHFVVRINPYTVMKAATVRGRRRVSDHIRGCIDLGANNLSALRAELDPKKVIELAKRINRARRIVVIGVDLAATLSHYFSYLLVAYGGFDAEAPVGSSAHLMQKINLLGSKDLLIAISFGRCLRDTVEGAVHGGKRGVPTFGITDSNRSPIARFCDSCLIVPTASAELSVSYVAPASVIEAVLTACAYLNPKRTLAVLKHKDEEERQPNSRWYDASSDGIHRRGKNVSAKSSGE